MEAIFLIIAILYGVINFFSGKEEHERNPKPVLTPRQPSAPKPKPTPTPSGRTYIPPTEVTEYPEVRIEEYMTSEEEPPTEVSIDPNSELAKSDIMNQSGLVPVRRKTITQEENMAPHISIKSQINKKRIVEGIIMSEVLGAPRAHKPFEYDYKRRK